MAAIRGFSFVLLLVLVLCIGYKEVAGRKSTLSEAPWVAQLDSRCCREHPELGHCQPGVDDSPENDGKCWTFCVEDCEKGGFCKLFGNRHKCHCYC